MQEFNDSINKTKDDTEKLKLARKCLNKIWSLADQGESRSSIYRFFHGQTQSSVARYKKIKDEIDAFNPYKQSGQ
jgi:hypothetical protein